MYSWAQHCSKSWVSVWKNSKADELMRLWELSQPCSCMMWKVQLSLHPEEKLSSINLLNMFGGKVPHKLREFVLFMLLWTELKFSCCWFTEILQMNLLSFFLTFWDCFQVSGEVFISTSSAHELTSCVWILWSRQCILKTESKSFKKNLSIVLGGWTSLNKEHTSCREKLNHREEIWMGWTGKRLEPNWIWAWWNLNPRFLSGLWPGHSRLYRDIRHPSWIHWDSFGDFSVDRIYQI